MNALIFHFALFGLSAEEAAAFDRLGSVAILVLVLVVFMRMVKDLGVRLERQTDKLSEILEKNAGVMIKMTESNDRQVDTHETLHTRMDNLLSCPARECPVRKLRVARIVRPERADTATGTAPLTPDPAV